MSITLSEISWIKWCNAWRSRYLPHIGDGNWFYRSIAFAITGSQTQHLAVRQAIVDHMLVVGDVLTGNSSIGIAEYITNNSVERPGTWATENEIYAVCHLLRIDLHVYSNVQGDWLKTTPRTMDPTLDSRDISDMSIYINHAHSHYEVVQSVSPCPRCCPNNAEAANVPSNSVPTVTSAQPH